MARSSFDDGADYRGGALADHTPRRLRYPCFAAGCPMPGTIRVDGAGAPTCAWHYGVLATDIPKVTAALREWESVSFEVREARRVLTGELATDPKAVDDAFAQAWERLQPLVGEWAEHLAPGTIRTRNRFTGQEIETIKREGYGDWAKRLNAFLGGRVRDVLTVRSMQRSAA